MPVRANYQLCTSVSKIIHATSDRSSDLPFHSAFVLNRRRRRRRLRMTINGEKMNSASLSSPSPPPSSSSVVVLQQKPL